MPEESSILQFHAMNVVADSESRTLGFCDQADETWEHYLIMVRDESEPFDYADDLGEIYVERDDQCWGGYGGIEQVMVERNRFTIDLGPRMRRCIGYDSIRVTFEVEKERFEDIQFVLGLIMQGYESQVFYRD